MLLLQGGRKMITIQKPYLLQGRIQIRSEDTGPRCTQQPSKALSQTGQHRDYMKQLCSAVKKYQRNNHFTGWKWGRRDPLCTIKSNTFNSIFRETETAYFSTVLHTLHLSPPRKVFARGTWCLGLITSSKASNFVAGNMRGMEMQKTTRIAELSGHCVASHDGMRVRMSSVEWS